jgi:iron complex transport system substrate-binding protein
VKARDGWKVVPAVKDDQLFEIKSAEILQPGPAALTDGVQRMLAIFRTWAEWSGS